MDHVHKFIRARLLINTFLFFFFLRSSPRRASFSFYRCQSRARIAMLVSVHRINCVLLYRLCVFGLVFGHRAANLNGGKNSGLLYDQAVFVLVCFVFFSFYPSRVSFPFSLTVMLISAKTPAEQQQQRQEQHERRKRIQKDSCVLP